MIRRLLIYFVILFSLGLIALAVLVLTAPPPQFSPQEFLP